MMNNLRDSRTEAFLFEHSALFKMRNIFLRKFSFIQNEKMRTFSFISKWEYIISIFRHGKVIKRQPLKNLPHSSPDYSKSIWTHWLFISDKHVNNYRLYGKFQTLWGSRPVLYHTWTALGRLIRASIRKKWVFRRSNTLTEEEQNGPGAIHGPRLVGPGGKVWRLFIK